MSRTALLALLILTASATAGYFPAHAQEIAAQTFAVVIDPAHGGPDPGARDSEGLTESDLVLELARAVRAALEGQGWRVLLTREGNQTLSFDDRSALVNGLRDAVFVTLHVSPAGPPGTARAYWYDFGSLPEAPDSDAPAGARPTPAGLLSAHPVSPSGLVEWDRAQQPYVLRSRRLAELVQIQLAQYFPGSPETPTTTRVRQLRTIAAPAVAIELSSVASGNRSALSRVGEPLSESIARAIAAFRALSSGRSAASRRP